jgi:GWxTD domain-containing protein
MKHKTIQILATAILLLGLSPLLHALDLGVSYAVMATPEDGYVEINLEIAPLSLSWTRIDSTTVRAGAEVLILIKNGENIVAYEKYILNSPALEYPKVLLDIKRMAVPNGTYELEVTAVDIADAKNTARFAKKIAVNVTQELYLTEAQLLRGFKKDTSGSSNPLVKNGFYMEPLPFGFYDRYATTLAFYAEIYHSNTVIKDPTYMLRYIVEKELGNGQTQLISVGNQKKRPSVIDGALVDMDISLLESGNYSLTLELRNKQNELLTSRKLYFERSNPFLNVKEADLSAEAISKQFVQDLDEKSLRYSLKAISPLVTMGTAPEELKNILKGDDLAAMRYFLFSHFVRTDPNNPELAWRSFMETANAADKQFHSGFRYGFETDRGRTYIKYGRPDDMIHVEDDPSAPPYEIWVYYNFPKTNQRNVKFLFYNPSLAGDDFIMLHSTARGEVNNAKWEITLYKRNANTEFEGDNQFDATRMQSNINRRARAYFEDF